MYMCVGCGCSLLLDICIFSCLRAPRKIDSSIGLPSLNKVVTYLLTYFLFSTTCLINSIKHEHSCKIIYLYDIEFGLKSHISSENINILVF